MSKIFLHVVAGAVLMANGVGTIAQIYPAKPVRVIVGFAKGGTQDIIARLVGQPLSERLGQEFIFENRTGAAGNIATEAVVEAPADGYTLLVVGLSNVVNASLYSKLNFDFVRDIAPVAGIVRVPGVMAVMPSFPTNSVIEFIAYAKTNSGGITMGSAGNGSPAHLYGELFKLLSGVSLVHSPRRGGGLSLDDLLTGQVQIMFNPLPETISYIRSSKLRALAVTTATRAEALPGVPSLGDFLPNYEASSWYGIGSPKNTPTEMVSRLNREINSALVEPKLKARLTELGGILLTGSADDFGKLMAEEAAKWSRVIKAAGIKPQ